MISYKKWYVICTAVLSTAFVMGLLTFIFLDGEAIPMQYDENSSTLSIFDVHMWAAALMFVYIYQEWSARTNGFWRIRYSSQPRKRLFWLKQGLVLEILGFLFLWELVTFCLGKDFLLIVQQIYLITLGVAGAIFGLYTKPQREGKDLLWFLPLIVLWNIGCVVNSINYVFYLVAEICVFAAYFVSLPIGYKRKVLKYRH